MAKQHQTRMLIAATAARLMAQDGIDDFSLAKRKAARQLGLGDAQTLPRNEEIEEQLRAYQDLYQGQEQHVRLGEMRQLALAVMQEIAVFRPYLVGQVLSGVAGRYATIDLQVFTDEAKSLELLLLNRGIDYRVAEQRRWISGVERAIPALILDWQGCEVSISVFGATEERMGMKTSRNGRVMDRANLAALESLVKTLG